MQSHLKNPRSICVWSIISRKHACKKKNINLDNLIILLFKRQCSAILATKSLFIRLALQISTQAFSEPHSMADSRMPCFPTRDLMGQ